MNGGNSKFQIPNPKQIRNPKTQIPDLRPGRFELGAWILEFVWNLVLGF
jgi:hypothetical protein